MPLSSEIQELLATLEQTPTSYTRNGSSLFVGTSLGEVFLFQKGVALPLDIFSSGAAFSICVISILDNFMACADIAGNIHVYNSNSKKNIAHIIHGSWHVEHLLFLDKETLLISYGQGKIYQEKLTPLEENKSANLPFRKIDALHILENKKFALLEHEGCSFALFDIVNHKLLHSKFITTSNKIKKATLKNNKLEIISTNNFTNSYNLCDSDELGSLLLHNTLSEAFALIEHNPILRTTASYEKLSILYEEILQEAFKAISHQNQELFSRACTMLEYKKDVLHSLQKTYKAYPRFCEFVQEKRFALAFGLSTEHPYLQKFPLFIELQKHYTQAFQRAQKYILHNEMLHAKEALAPFITIPAKREIIKLFLEQNQLFLEFFKAIEQNDFYGVEEIVQKEKRFKKLSNYQIFIESLPSFIKEILHTIYNANTSLAIHMIEKLPLSQNRLTLQQIAEAMKQLLSAYERNDFITCHTLLDIHDALLGCEIAQLLEKHWGKITTKARESAKRGAIDGVSQSLGIFVDIPSRKSMVTSIFKVALYYKIISILEQKEYKEAEKAMYAYVDTFGKDYTMTLLMQKFKEKSPTPLALLS